MPTDPSIQVWSGDGEIPEHELERIKQQEERRERVERERKVRSLALRAEREARRKRMSLSQTIRCIRFEHHHSYTINGKTVITLTALLDDEAEIGTIHLGEKRPRLSFQYPGFPDPLKPLEVPVVWTFVNGSITSFKRLVPNRELPHSEDDLMDDEPDWDSINLPLYAFQIECDSVEDKL